MKKLIMTLMFFIFTGCSNGNIIDNTSSFNATVIEIDKHTVLVEPVEGEDILSSSNRIRFWHGELDEINASVDDIVTITYSGGVRETNPAQIDVVNWSILQKSEQ